jgi:hypothetical protein
MGGAGNTHRRDKNCIQTLWLENLNGMNGKDKKCIQNFDLKI